MKAGLEHALERALQRAEGDLLLWRRIATILSQDKTMAGRVLPDKPLVRIVAPSGQLIVDRGVVVSFYHAASNPRPGEVSVGLKEVADLIDRIIEREAQEALPRYKIQVFRKERKTVAKAVTLKEVIALIESFPSGVDTTTLGAMMDAFEGRRSISLANMISYGVKIGALRLENGWVVAAPNQQRCVLTDKGWVVTNG